MLLRWCKKIIYYKCYYDLLRFMLTLQTGKDNPILRKVSEPITKKEWKKYSKLGNEMIKYIKNPKHAGVGLAAPQIGINKRIIVVSLISNWDDEQFSTIMMFNPKILEKSKEQVTNVEEWCLSLPDTKKWFVARHKDIKLTYFDEKMKQHTLRISWLASVIVQHEIDHLDGILFIDKLI